MKLPNASAAVVPRAKIVDYLLSVSHHDGCHKAAFFRSFGFAVDSPEVLEIALRSIASKDDVVREEHSPFGRRFIVDGIIKAPDGRTAFVRTIWFVETGESSPRLVTAYPAPIRR